MERPLHEVIYDSLVDMGLKEKYGRPGIYSISIGEKLVYIGKSRDMLVRISNHLEEIETNEKTNKYIVLRAAREKGIRLNFDVM